MRPIASDRSDPAGLRRPVSIGRSPDNTGVIGKRMSDRTGLRTPDSNGTSALVASVSIPDNTGLRMDPAKEAAGSRMDGIGVIAGSNAEITPDAAGLRTLTRGVASLRTLSTIEATGERSGATPEMTGESNDATLETTGMRALVTGSMAGARADVTGSAMGLRSESSGSRKATASETGKALVRGAKTDPRRPSTTLCRLASPVGRAPRVEVTVGQVTDACIPGHRS